jgi:ribosomal-protein-alanine N-acetyltransferase
MSEEAPRIRRFRPEDIQQILEVESQAFPKTPYSRAVFLDLARVFPQGFLVLEADAQIAGYLVFNPQDGHILSMAMKSACRRQGFAAMLFRHALKRARKGLWIEVRTRNNPAIAFYKKMGMETVGKAPGYYSDDDALIMEIGRR